MIPTLQETHKLNNTDFTASTKHRILNHYTLHPQGKNNIHPGTVIRTSALYQDMDGTMSPEGARPRAGAQLLSSYQSPRSFGAVRLSFYLTCNSGAAISLKDKGYRLVSSVPLIHLVFILCPRQLIPPLFPRTLYSRN